MSKFKVGDKARLTKYYSEFWPEGHEFEVTELVDGGTYLKGRIVGGGEGTITAAWCIPIESELERLVRVANEGFLAWQEIHDRFGIEKVQLSSQRRGNGAYPPKYIELIEVRKKPALEPFTVGSGWQVKLEGETLHIGCKTFKAFMLKTDLKSVIYGEGRDYGLTATRDGVRDKDGHKISWTDADKILAALEKAGIK